jgi:hypothetical protein
MTISVSTPDGGIAEFPDGTPQSTMESALQAKFPSSGGASAMPGGYTGGVATQLLSGATAGLSDRVLGLVTPGGYNEVTKQNQQWSAANPASSLAANAAGYGMGLGKLGIGEGVASKLAPTMGANIARVMGYGAEGAVAGGASDLVANPSDPSSAIPGALGGAALGATAGALTPGANKVLQGVFGNAASVDPAAAIAQTKAQSRAAYDALSNVSIPPAKVMQSIGSATTSLDPSEVTGLSGAFKGQVGDIQNALNDELQGGRNVHAGMVDSWQRQINQAATSPTDTLAAGRISSALDDVLQAHGAGDLQAAAKNAFAQSQMAENLGEWSRKTAAGAPLGQAPLTEAERFYQGQPQQYETLVDLFKQGQGGPGPMASTLGHIAAHAAGGAGAAIAGFPGWALGEAVGLGLVKPAAYKLMKGYDRNTLLKAYQAAYPSMTGVQPTGGAQAPQIGDLIKNAMIGSVY